MLTFESILQNTTNWMWRRCDALPARPSPGWQKQTSVEQLVVIKLTYLVRANSDRGMPKNKIWVRITSCDASSAANFAAFAGRPKIDFWARTGCLVPHTERIGTWGWKRSIRRVRNVRNRRAYLVYADSSCETKSGHAHDVSLLVPRVRAWRCTEMSQYHDVS